MFSNLFCSFKRLWISNQAQGVSLLTSHFPSREVPPQGPLKRLLAHLVTGHIPPVSPRTHSLQARQFSSNHPISLSMPIKVVFKAGKAGLVGYRSARNWTPAPHAIDSRAS